MKLPVINYPIYDVPLLSRDKPIRVRPFTVKESQLLLMAIEAQDLKSMISTIRQVISNCLISTDYNIDEMTMIDMETIFINLRARSIGEVASQFYKCKNVVEDKECGMILKVDINLLEVPIINKDVQKKIEFTGDMGVFMRYPPFNILDKIEGIKDTDVEFCIAAACIDKVYDKESVFYSKECSDSDLFEFITKLPVDKYEKVKDFIDNCPKTRMVVDKTCEKCNYQHQFVLEGLQDFFV